MYNLKERCLGNFKSRKQLIEQKSCNLFPQLGKIPKIETKMGDRKSKKGLLSHITGKIREKNFFIRVTGIKCHDKTKKNCRGKKIAKFAKFLS